MKTIKHFCLGFILSISSIFTACNSELSEIVEQSGDIVSSADSLTKFPTTRSMWFDSAAMEWWSTHKGTGPSGCEHSTDYNNYSICDWTLDTCSHYVLIRSSYDMGKVSYMQIQYRFLPQHLEIHDDLIPESSWHFLGEEYAQDEYPYGVVKLECRLLPEVEVNAHAFPKGRIGIRYRVFDHDFPGYPGPNGYNTDLMSGWIYTHGLDYHSNDYGYVLNSEALTIHVSFPKGSLYVSYSAEISIEGGESTHTYNNGAFSLKKVYSKGTYSVTARESSSFSGPDMKAYDFGYYDEKTTDVYVNFDVNDFRVQYP